MSRLIEWLMIFVRSLVKVLHSTWLALIWKKGTTSGNASGAQIDLQVGK